MTITVVQPLCCSETTQLPKGCCLNHSTGPGSGWCWPTCWTLEAPIGLLYRCPLLQLELKCNLWISPKIWWNSVSTLLKQTSPEFCKKNVWKNSPHNERTFAHKGALSRNPAHTQKVLIWSFMYGCICGECQAVFLVKVLFCAHAMVFSSLFKYPQQTYGRNHPKHSSYIGLLMGYLSYSLIIPNNRDRIDWQYPLGYLKTTYQPLHVGLVYLLSIFWLLPNNVFPLAFEQYACRRYECCGLQGFQAWWFPQAGTRDANWGQVLCLEFVTLVFFTKCARAAAHNMQLPLRHLSPDWKPFDERWATGSFLTFLRSQLFLAFWFTLMRTHVHQAIPAIPNIAW